MYRTLSTLSLLVASSVLAASCNSTGQSAAPVDAAEGSGIVTRGDDERTAQLRSALEAFTRNDQDFAKSYTSEDHKIYMADGSEPVGLEEWNAFADARLEVSSGRNSMSALGFALLICSIACVAFSWLRHAITTL